MDVAVLADRLLVMRLQADAVIGGVNIAIGDFKIVAIDNIHSVVIPVGLAVDDQFPNDYVPALVILLVPAGWVFQGDALNPNILAAPEINVLRPNTLPGSVVAQGVLN